ncbi:hypothetical protein ABIG04_003228 [Bradyrhizobium japonicum]
MISYIAIKLLNRSHTLARCLTLNALLRAEKASPTMEPYVSVLGLIVCVDLDTDSLSNVRSQLEADRVVFSRDTKFPNELLGRVGNRPWLRLSRGHNRTLHLSVEISDEMKHPL